MKGFTFSRFELCQENQFGIRKSIEIKLNKLGVELEDEQEIFTVNLLKYFLDFFEFYQLPDKKLKLTSAATVEDIKKDGVIIINPMWARLLKEDDLSFIWNSYCKGTREFIPSFLPFSQNSLPQTLFRLGYSQEELATILKNNLNVELRSESKMPQFKLEQPFNKFELLKILSSLMIFHKSILRSDHLKYISRVKTGYELKDSQGVEYSYKEKMLKFSDKFFSNHKDIIQDKDFIRAMGRYQWVKMNESKRKRFKAISWIKRPYKKSHKYFWKKNAAFINEQAGKSLNDDFTEHFLYYIINGTYLKEQNNLKYLFLRNNYFGEVIYQSEKEKFDQLQKSKRYKQYIKAELDEEKNKKHFVPLKVEAQAQPIEKMKTISRATLVLYPQSGVSKFSVDISEGLNHSKNKITGFKVLDLRDWVEGQYFVKELILEGKKGSETLYFEKGNQIYIPGIKLPTSAKEGMKYSFEKNKDDIVNFSIQNATILKDAKSLTILLKGQFDELTFEVTADEIKKFFKGNNINFPLVVHPSFPDQEFKLVHLRMKQSRTKYDVLYPPVVSFKHKNQQAKSIKDFRLEKMVHRSRTTYTMELNPLSYDFQLSFKMKDQWKVIDFKSKQKKYKKDGLEIYIKDKKLIISVIEAAVGQLKKIEVFEKFNYSSLKNGVKDVFRGRKVLVEVSK